MRVLWYHCKCGYQTPVDTGMMIHLRWAKWWERLLRKHEFLYAKEQEGEEEKK